MKQENVSSHTVIYEKKKARVVFVVDVGNMKSSDVIGVCLLSQSAPEKHNQEEKSTKLVNF